MFWSGPPILRFSPGAEAVLRKAGWFPGRRVGPSGWIAQLEPEGFRSSPAAEAALTTLGGLVVTPPRRTDTPVAPERFEIDPAHGSGEADRLPCWEAKIGGPVFPLGLAYAYHWLLIGGNGRVFVGDDSEDVALVGASVHEAVDALTLGTRRPTPVG